MAEDSAFLVSSLRWCWRCWATNYILRNTDPRATLLQVVTQESRILPSCSYDFRMRKEEIERTCCFSLSWPWTDTYHFCICCWPASVTWVQFTCSVVKHMNQWVLSSLPLILRQEANYWKKPKQCELSVYEGWRSFAFPFPLIIVRWMFSIHLTHEVFMQYSGCQDVGWMNSCVKLCWEIFQSSWASCVSYQMLRAHRRRKDETMGTPGTEVASITHPPAPIMLPHSSWVVCYSVG